MPPKNYREIINRIDPKTGLPIEESILTDEELKERQEAYQGIIDDPGEIIAKFSKRIQDELGKYGGKLPSNIFGDIATYSYEKLKNGTFNGKDVAGSISNSLPKNFPNRGGIANKLVGSIRVIYENLLEEQQKPSLDVSRIEDILSSRAEEGRKTGLAESALAELPEQLRTSRERFLAEREDAKSQFVSSRVRPQVISELNTRGLAESPDVLSETARRAAGLQGTIEEQFRTLEQEDASFLADAAFRITTAKLDLKEADFRTYLANERDRVRLGQEDRFRTSENKIQSDFDLDILSREQERNTRLRKAGIDISFDTAQAERNAGNAESIGSSVGEIVGTKVGTKISGAPASPNQDPKFTPSFSRIG